MYDLNAITNATGFGDIITTANSFSQGVMSKMFIIAVFVVIVLSFRQQDFEINIAIGSFICFILSLLMSYAEWLTFYFPIGFLLILALDMLYIYTRR